MSLLESSTLPTHLTGTWQIDPVHSEVAFSVRHLMVSKVRGRFGDFSGTIVVAENPLESRVQAVVALASIDTGNEGRDEHVRSADFFDVGQYPELTFRSTGVRANGDDFIVDGELSLHGVTKQVPLHLEVTGFQETTPFGDTRVGFSATAEINRDDFGITFNTVLEGGGVGLGRKIQIALEIQAVRENLN
ncbi:MAG: YceI family protein [Acidimicrobiales bacterium]